MQSNHRAFSMLEQGIVVFFLALGTKFMRISFFILQWRPFVNKLVKFVSEVKSERRSREGASCMDFNNKFDQTHFFAHKFASFLTLGVLFRIQELILFRMARRVTSWIQDLTW